MRDAPKKLLREVPDEVLVVTSERRWSCLIFFPQSIRRSKLTIPVESLTGDQNWKPTECIGQTILVCRWKCQSSSSGFWPSKNQCTKLPLSPARETCELWLRSKCGEITRQACLTFWSSSCKCRSKCGKVAHTYDKQLHPVLRQCLT